MQQRSCFTWRARRIVGMRRTGHTSGVPPVEGAIETNQTLYIRAPQSHFQSLVGIIPSTLAKSSECRVRLSRE